jgi:hypothetical protein
MKTFEFTVIITGQDIEDDDFIDAVFEAGCDDSTLSLQKGVIIADFTRESVSFSRAVIQACQQLQSTGATIERVEPDHLVSLSEIAERSNLSRQAISLYIKGDRQDHFPGPAAKVTSKHPLWDWHEVTQWLFERNYIDRKTVVQARVVKEVNIHLNSSSIPADSLMRRMEAHEAA